MDLPRKKIGYGWQCPHCLTLLGRIDVLKKTGYCFKCEIPFNWYTMKEGVANEKK